MSAMQEGFSALVSLSTGVTESPGTGHRILGRKLSEDMQWRNSCMNPQENET